MTTYVLNEYQTINAPVWLGTITHTDKGHKAYYCVGDKPTPLLNGLDVWFDSSKDAEEALKRRFCMDFSINVAV